MARMETDCNSRKLDQFFQVFSSRLGKIDWPFEPWNENAYSPYCYPYIYRGTSKENLSKYQDILSLVISSFILITWVFEKVVIM